MTQPLSILIVDADRYFAYGLRLGLQDYFQSRDQAIHLLDETQTEGKIDIIFLGDLITSPPWLYRLHQQNCRPMVFFIKPKGRHNDVFRQGVQCGKCNAGTLYRHQALFSLFNLLESVQSSHTPPSAPFHHECPCMSPLTPREIDVLRCIYQGMNGRDTGAHLDINVKTANAHKQSAMRKLNFRCNQELYQWLLQGGGRYLNERVLAEQSLLSQQPEMPTESSTRLNNSYPALARHQRSKTQNPPEHAPGLCTSMAKTV